MVAILEVPEVRRMVSPISVAQYHRLPEYAPSGRRTELVRGVIFDKTSKSSLHVMLLRRLLRLVQAAAGDGFLVFKEDPLTFSDSDSEPEPDICVVAGREGDFDQALPTTARLVIEVALTSLALDRAKLAIYAEAGVPECWLVVGIENKVEVYAEPLDGFYQQHRVYAPGETLVSAVLPDLRVEVAALFAA